MNVPTFAGAAAGQTFSIVATNVVAPTAVYVAGGGVNATRRGPQVRGRGSSLARYSPF